MCSLKAGKCRQHGGGDDIQYAVVLKDADAFPVNVQIQVNVPFIPFRFSFLSDHGMNPRLGFTSTVHFTNTQWCTSSDQEVNRTDKRTRTCRR
jgi:hypothetical protein